MHGFMVLLKAILGAFSFDMSFLSSSFNVLLTAEICTSGLIICSLEYQLYMCDRLGFPVFVIVYLAFCGIWFSGSMLF